MDQNDTETQVEQPTQEGATSQSDEQVVDQPQSQEQLSPESETGTNEVSEVPKDNAAWAAMRTENKRLKEAVSQVDPVYFESLRSATGPQAQYQPPQIQEVSGDAEYNQVIQGVNTANSQAARAMQELARLRTQYELQQDREAERAFPALKTDKAFQQIVSEKKLAARVLGHDRTTIEIAEEVERLFSRRDEQVAAKTVESTRKNDAQRQVISSEPRGQSTSGKQVAGSDELRSRVRRGDMGAQTEVAKNLIADLEF
jgi:hypothetical protein